MRPERSPSSCAPCRHPPDQRPPASIIARYARIGHSSRGIPQRWRRRRCLVEGRGSGSCGRGGARPEADRAVGTQLHRDVVQPRSRARGPALRPGRQITINGGDVARIAEVAEAFIAVLPSPAATRPQVLGFPRPTYHHPRAQGGLEGVHSRYWPCGQNPGRGPKAADALLARETMEPRRTGFDLQGHALSYGSTDHPSEAGHDCSIGNGDPQPSFRVGQPASDSS